MTNDAEPIITPAGHVESVDALKLIIPMLAAEHSAFTSSLHSRVSSGYGIKNDRNLAYSLEKVLKNVQILMRNIL